MKRKSFALQVRFANSCKEFQSVQSHNSTKNCGEYDECAVWIDLCELVRGFTYAIYIAHFHRKWSDRVPDVSSHAVVAPFEFWGLNCNLRHLQPPSS